jgi:hypothetical protein
MTDILPLLSALAQSVAALRKVLESNELTSLEPVLAEVQSYLDKVNGFPGGTQGLQQAMAQLPEPTRSETQQLLEQAKLDHQINSQLIRLAMQRNAALQAYTAQSSAAATYSSEGGVAMVNTGQLLGKF